MSTPQIDHAPVAPEEPRRLGRIDALDGYRAVAVALVLAYHAACVLVPGRVLIYPDGPFPGGYLGVDLFFVLSGFLISALLLGEQAATDRIDLWSYARRRMFRLLPALYTFLALYMMYSWLTGLSMSTTWSSVRAALVYVTNISWIWPDAPRSGAFGHLWTLALEGQFYLVWPFVLIACKRLRIQRLLAPLIVILIAAVTIRRWMLFDHGVNPVAVYTATSTRADSLLVGALLAVAWSNRWIPRRGLSLAATIATVVFAVIAATSQWYDRWMYHGGFLVVALCAAVMIATITEGNWWLTKVLGIRPMQAIGRVSYGIYIWHLPVFVAVVRYGSDWSGTQRMLVAAIGTTVTTLSSWYVVEKPFLRRKRKVGDAGAREA